MPEKDFWIKRVEIKNFQSHKDTQIDFVKGTNALVGSSNSGKSAVIRAIRWCLLNVPSGTEFITVGEKETIVKVYLSNGKLIERIRNRGNTNLYNLYQGEKLIGEYTGFGSKVPEDILEAHGMVPIGNKIFFQFAEQLEAPFMLSLRPSQRAEILGNLEELTRIDNALSSVNDDLRLDKKEKVNIEKKEKSALLKQSELKHSVNSLKERIESLKILRNSIETKANLFNFLKEQHKRILAIDKEVALLNAEINKYQRAIALWPKELDDNVKKYKDLKGYYDRLVQIDRELASMKLIDEAKLTELGQIISSVEEKISKYKDLTKVHNQLQQSQSTIKQMNEEISKVDKVKSIRVQDIEKDIERYKLLSNYHERLVQVDKSIVAADEQIEEAQKQTAALLEELVEALQEQKVCPTCGRETESLCVEHLNQIG